jgi:hypothetical protein
VRHDAQRGNIFMRFIFLIVFMANVAVLAYGQGFFGTPPSEQGREPRQLSERNQHAITLGKPLAAGQLR